MRSDPAPLEDGGSEANPLMQLAIAHSQTLSCGEDRRDRAGSVVARGPSAVAARRVWPLWARLGVWGGARLSPRALFTVGVAAHRNA